MDIKNPMIKLNLGCGNNTPEGWINIDGSWNVLLAKWPFFRRFLKILHLIPSSVSDVRWESNIIFHDVRKNLPFADGTVDIIYSSHLIEHLYLSESKVHLKDCYRVLKKEGIIRIVVPDLKFIISEYIKNSENDKLVKADILCKKLLMRAEDPPRGSFMYRLYTCMKDLHSHKWQYDADSLIYHVKNAGFRNVNECSFLESKIPDIHAIEQPERVLHGSGICVEGVR